MLAHRLRRWASIISALLQRLVYAGSAIYESSVFNGIFSFKYEGLINRAALLKGRLVY